MAYYNPYRKKSWNYGGENWVLSRSKIDLFLECPRCFYFDNKLGTKRPPGYPFNLNRAVDELLKKEFDILREKGETHKLIEEYGIDARPVAHEKLNEWRDNFKGVRYKYKPTGFTISGAIDDLWINSKGEYIVVDYKATSKNEEITKLDKDWQNSYKKQIEVYQWLLRQNGFKVSDIGYFVYCNGRTDVDKFDGQLEFDIRLIPYEGNDAWIEDVLTKIYKTLESNEIPDSGLDCDFCAYHRAVSGYEENK
jgi:CRISPR/Cas system-associated exonuclease Cas4 (RecB family)